MHIVYFIDSNYDYALSNAAFGCRGVVMFTDERFDFSRESDLKERLWEKMEHRMKQASALRSEVSLDSISPQRAAKPDEDVKPKQAPAKSRSLK